jgi:tetratricopeptide (TPR) repeat protein
MLLGEVLDAGNQTEQAAAEFEAAAKASPSEPEVHFGLGYLYWKQQRYEDAIREFRAELAFQRQHLQSLIYLGDAEMHLGATSAEEHVRQALVLDKNVRLAHLDLGILLADKGDSTGAIEHWREAIRIDPSKPDAHYRLGRLLRSLHRDAEAESEFAKVKDLATATEAHPEPLVKLADRPHP